MSILKLFKKNHSHNSALSPINSDRKLPKRIEDFESYHYKVLRRLKNHPVNKELTGIITIEVDIPNFIPVLMDLNLIKIGTYEDGLEALNTDALKSILRQYGLKVSGNKAELIERITSNIDEAEVRQSQEYTDIYVYTDITKPVIDASYDKLDEERSAFFQEAIDFILSGDLDTAYRMICKRNAEMPVPPGLGTVAELVGYWENEYYNGLKEYRREIYINQLKTAKDRTIVAMAIYQSMCGALREARQYKESSANNKSEIRNIGSSISADRHRQGYIRDNIKKYRYVSCLDGQTCPICGELDGKVFSVDEIAPGVNYPPMHDGCRCTTIAAWDDLQLKGMRFARDPITHRGMQVPVDMTYIEYKKEYLDK